jgi:hypothetical protein
MLDEDAEAGSVTLQNKRGKYERELQRLKQIYVLGYFEDDLEYFEREHRRIQKELDSLPATTDLATLEASAGMLDQLLGVWDEADPTEKRDLLRLVLRQVEVDVAQQRLVSLSPYPAFVPLFRQADYLLEVEFGRFIPLWPPAVAAKFSPDPQLPAVTAASLPRPTQAVAWPLVLTLPEAPAQKRISPALSDQLKALRQAGQPLQRLVDINPTGYPALRLDIRKWPEAVLTELPAITALNDLPPGRLSFLRTVLAPLTAELAEQVAGLLAPGGLWLTIDLLPAAMPGHWLFRYFPEAKALVDRFSATEQYRRLQELGLSVKMELQTYGQAVSIEAALTMATLSRANGLLAEVSAGGYEQGVAQLHALAAERGRETLLPSHFCLLETKAFRGQ